MKRSPFAALTLLALMSCTGGNADTQPTTGPAAPEGAPVRRDSLIVAHPADIGHLNPVVVESANDTAIADGNLNYRMADAAFDCSIKKLPGFAKEWSWSDDGKVLSLTLRDDIRWSDGRPVTADDVKFTFDLIADPEVASPRIASIQRMLPDKRPEVIDTTHIAFHFVEAYDRDTQFAHATSLSLVAKHALETADRKTLRGHPYDRDPLVTGPWKIEKNTPGQTIVLAPNPAFTGPAELRPNLNRVIFKIIPDYHTRLLSLEKGEVDMMEGITVADADRLAKEHPEIKLYRRGWRFLDYVAWNLSNPLFADVKVRRALAFATNVDGMIDRLLTSKATGESYGRRAVGTITPELCGIHNDSIQPIPHDVAQAKALLTEAGWADTDDDGVLDKNGQKFTFRLLTNKGNQRRADAAILIQAMLKDVGVEVTLEQQETNAFFENLRKKEYEAALSGWSAALFVDPSNMWHSDTPERKYEFNFTGYANPAADALIDRGLAMPDPKDAAPVWSELQQVIYQDQPYMFLYWRDDVVGLHNRFENVEVDILSPFNHLHAWSVPESKVKYPQ